MKRRHTIIPELVELVKSYASHERTAWLSTASERTRAINAASLAEKARAEDSLSRSLGNLLAVSEAYPTLRSDRSFLSLQEELISIEEGIRFSRQFYNDTVMRYNTMIATFPNILISKLLSFKAEDYFIRQGPNG